MRAVSAEPGAGGGVMFDLKVMGTEKLVKALEKLSMAPKQLQKELHNAGRIIQKAAVENVSNKTLHRRTGNLATSIKIDDSKLDQLEVRVGVSKQAVYGAYHEFGGKSKPHIIYPRTERIQIGGNIKTHAAVNRGGVLRFPIAFGIKSRKATRFAFATHVHHPGSVIPKRPWLMPAYEDNKERIVETFRLSLERGLNMSEFRGIE